MKIRFRYLILFTLTIAFLVYAFLTKRDNENLTDWLAVTIYSPVTRSVTSFRDGIKNTVRNYFFLVGTSKENLDLKKELNILKVKNHVLRGQIKLLQKKEQLTQRFYLVDYNVIASRVLNYDIFVQSSSFTIDKGLLQGVQVNDVVVSPDGIVGRILQVFENSSRVLLLTDSHFAIDAINKRTGVRVMVSGLDEKKLNITKSPFLSKLEYLSRAQDLEKGDELISSGMGTLYPRGIPIGTVNSVDYKDEGLFDEATVLPAVELSSLTEVYILTPKDRKNHQMILLKSISIEDHKDNAESMKETTKKRK